MAGRKLSASRQRITYLDVLRLLAAFLVIVNHTNSQIFKASVPSAGWYVSLAWFFSSKPAVPIFLMITGALFLDKQTDWKKWRWQIIRALTVVVVANLIYYFYHVYWLHRRANRTFELANAVKGIFGRETTALWYLYLWLASVLFMPFFRKLAQTMTKREERLLILLSVGLGGVLKLLPVIWRALTINKTYYEMALSVYVGLMFLGHYLHTYTKPRAGSVFWSMLIFLAVLAAELWITRGLYAENHKAYLGLDDRTMITVSIQAVCIFQIVRFLFRNADRKPALSRSIAFAGQQTFGIYLLGDLAIEEMKSIYSTLMLTIPRMGAMLIYEMAVFLACMAVTVLLRAIPGVKRFI